MREKLRTALVKAVGETREEGARARLKAQLSSLPLADICTMHVFCARLVRTYFYVEGIDPAAVYGYDREELTHTSVAAQIASGTADAGMGILSAARLYDLDFLPVCVEQYDLLIPDYAWGTPAVEALLGGTLSFSSDANCDHHGHHHGEGHECGHHHGENHDCGHHHGDAGCQEHHHGHGHGHGCCHGGE